VPTHVLFVDDEPSIRVTLPMILEQHGFNVTAAATVAEALQAVASQTFDVLIADLNIGEQGDGFTVVSAMRRTQPDCINLILTGYPAFDSALEAIRRQVDDYLVKPANPAELVQSIRKRLEEPRGSSRIHAHRLASFLEQYEDEIVRRALDRMKTHPRLSRLQLSDTERVDHIPVIIRETIKQLESEQPRQPTEEAHAAGARHGETRNRQSYSLIMLVDDARILDTVIYDAVQDHLLELELSHLIPDLNRLNDTLEAHLQEAIGAFVGERAA
jgi:DNA-binding response OmpR family regulator